MTHLSNSWKKTTLEESAVEVKDKYKPTVEESFPYIGLEHIEQHTLRLKDVGDSSETQSTKTMFQPGDILYGSLRPYFRKVYQPDFEGVCSTDITVIRPLQNVDEKFLFWFLANYDFIDRASFAGQGTRMPRAGWKIVSKFEINLPPLDQQKRIASVLSAFDDKIEVNNRINAKLEEMAQAIFKEWFVHFRFPGHEQTRFVDSELGPIPEGWEVKSLGELVDAKTGKTNSQDAVENGQYPLFDRSMDIKSSDKYLFDNMAIIIPGEGKDFIPRFYEGKFDLHQRVYALFPYEKTIGYYLFYYLLENYELFHKYAVGSTAKSLRMSIINSIPILCPSGQLLKEYKEHVLPIRKLISIFEEENQQLVEARDVLLPKLLNGEVEV